MVAKVRRRSWTQNGTPDRRATSSRAKGEVFEPAPRPLEDMGAVPRHAPQERRQVVRQGQGMVAVVLRVLDRQRAPEEVHVLPLEPERLAPAQPGQQDQLQVVPREPVVEPEHGIHPGPQVGGA